MTSRNALGNFSRLDAGSLFEHHAVAVSSDELHRKIEVEQSRDGFPRHRAGKHVAADHDTIDSGPPHIAKDRLECGQISVKIVECRHLRSSDILVSALQNVV